MERYKDVVGPQRMYLHGNPRPGLVRLAMQGLRDGTGYERETARQRRACARELADWLASTDQPTLLDQVDGRDK